MKHKLRLVTVALVLGGLFVVQFSAQKTEAASNCDPAQCAEVGSILKCNGDEAVVQGTTQGSCISVSSDTRLNQDSQTVFCTLTKFFDCQTTPAQPGCPLSPGGCPGS